jgi:hypothetical protein
MDNRSSRLCNRFLDHRTSWNIVINFPRINFPRLDIPRLDIPRLDIPRLDIPRLEEGVTRQTFTTLANNFGWASNVLWHFGHWIFGMIYPLPTTAHHSHRDIRYPRKLPTRAKTTAL